MQLLKCFTKYKKQNVICWILFIFLKAGLRSVSTWLLGRLSPLFAVRLKLWFSLNLYFSRASVSFLVLENQHERPKVIQMLQWGEHHQLPLSTLLLSVFPVVKSGNFYLHWLYCRFISIHWSWFLSLYIGLYGKD